MASNIKIKTVNAETVKDLEIGIAQELEDLDSENIIDIKMSSSMTYDPDAEAIITDYIAMIIYK